jgi:fatty acid desaturase
MRSPTQKVVAITFGVIVVLFLLFASGGMSAPTVSGDMAVTRLVSEHSWIWIVPTLLIFGLGFLLAWVVFGPYAVIQERRKTTSDRTMAASTQANVCYWERADDPYHAMS